MEKSRVSQGRKGYAFEAACELLGGILYYSCKSCCLLIFIPAARGDKAGKTADVLVRKCMNCGKICFLTTGWRLNRCGEGISALSAVTVR